MKNQIISKDTYSEIIIKSTKGVFHCKIDNEDIEKVQQHRWHMQNKYVACKYKGGHLLLHRYLMNPQSAFQIDHKNRDTLDNRKQNLRICTQQQNLCNKNVQKMGNKANSHSKQKYIYKNGNLWRVVITYGGKQINLGNYKDIETANEIVQSCFKNIIWNY